MLDKKGFDLWAEGYERSVASADEDHRYPFAGYEAVLREMEKRVWEASAQDVLDIGFGTGALAARLYGRGLRVYGQDFSEEMIRIAREKMPDAKLYLGDFRLGLAEPLGRRRYDAIVAAYSLHHLADEEKVSFIKALRPLLNEGGMILIGDVAFRTREDLEACRKEAGEAWDEDEFYFVFEELKERLPALTFKACSFCSGVLGLGK